jgi:uncharacterized protein YjiS (DUF1127 family)
MGSSEDDANSVPDGPAASQPVAADPPGFYARLYRALAQWQVRAHSRRLLAELDEHMLRDIGIDRARVWLETGRWFWQP